MILWILLALLGVVLLGCLGILLWCFHTAYYADRKPSNVEFPIPEGKIYEPYRDVMIGFMKEVRQMPCECVSITSFDGLRLTGKYYEYSPDAPIELMFPGYRGEAERDLCGGVQRCFRLGHSALIVDQRACGGSEGHIISFGIHESLDCERWVQFMLKRFGPDVKIILTGISMGAATVMMAAGKPQPANVIGALADCGYTSGPDIIKKVIGDMKLPPKLAYPFARLAGKLFGGFDIEDASPIRAMEYCQIPIIFFHGEDDAYVPCEMSVRNYNACTAPKKLVTIPGAGHGLCYLIDPTTYLQALKDFWKENS